MNLDFCGAIQQFPNVQQSHNGHVYFSQWSDAMLSNLLYCQGRVVGSGSNSDLEAEWKKLYPASLLTARLILSNKNTTFVRLISPIQNDEVGNNNTS